MQLCFSLSEQELHEQGCGLPRELVERLPITVGEREGGGTPPPTTCSIACRGDVFWTVHLAHRMHPSLFHFLGLIWTAIRLSLREESVGMALPLHVCFVSVLHGGCGVREGRS